jgi:hypothetical protein
MENIKVDEVVEVTPTEAQKLDEVAENEEIDIERLIEAAVAKGFDNAC